MKGFACLAAFWNVCLLIFVQPGLRAVCSHPHSRQLVFPDYDGEKIRTPRIVSSQTELFHRDRSTKSRLQWPQNPFMTNQIDRSAEDPTVGAAAGLRTVGWIRRLQPPILDQWRKLNSKRYSMFNQQRLPLFTSATTRPSIANMQLIPPAVSDADAETTTRGVTRTGAWETQKTKRGSDYESENPVDFNTKKSFPFSWNDFDKLPRSTSRPNVDKHSTTSLIPSTENYNFLNTKVGDVSATNSDEDLLVECLGYHLTRNNEFPQQCGLTYEIPLVDELPGNLVKNPYTTSAMGSARGVENLPQLDSAIRRYFLTLQLRDRGEQDDIGENLNPTSTVIQYHNDVYLLSMIPISRGQNWSPKTTADAIDYLKGARNDVMNELDRLTDTEKGDVEKRSGGGVRVLRMG